MLVNVLLTRKFSHKVFAQYSLLVGIEIKASRLVFVHLIVKKIPVWQMVELGLLRDTFQTFFHHQYSICDVEL